jgi:AraC family transcriptional regulator of adaptative response/methylated-DNA-[protein]-cysteine methyltransferase
VGLSPFHFQRIFSEWAGISPKKFLQFLTVDYLKDRIRETKSIAAAADEAGLSSQSRVYDLFTTLEGVTPDVYKNNGAGIRLDYGFHDTPFGRCLIGVTERGICWLSFIPTDGDPLVALDDMKHHWYNSQFKQEIEVTGSLCERIFQTEESHDQAKLGVFVKGTKFQLKVWEALLRIPTGSLTTYQHIAENIAQPSALQAVGSAVGANHIAYLIPCHRVIRKDGQLGEYRWEATRKKSMIGWEQARVTVR